MAALRALQDDSLVFVSVVFHLPDGGPFNHWGVALFTYHGCLPTDKECNRKRHSPRRPSLPNSISFAPQLTDRICLGDRKGTCHAAPLGLFRRIRGPAGATSMTPMHRDRNMLITLLGLHSRSCNRDGSTYRSDGKRLDRYPCPLDRSVL